MPVKLVVLFAGENESKEYKVHDYNFSDGLLHMTVEKGHSPRKRHIPLANISEIEAVHG